MYLGSCSGSPAWKLAEDDSEVSEDREQTDAHVVAREDREEHEDADKLLMDLLAWRAMASRIAS